MIILKKSKNRKKKKEQNDNHNTQSNKHKETEIVEKGQLPITRNESNKWKDINENRENTKSKINQTVEQNTELKMKKTRRSKKIKNVLTNSKYSIKMLEG